MSHVDRVSVLIFGSKYPPATLKCNSHGINAAIDYIATVDIDITAAEYELIVAKFKQAAVYYLRERAFYDNITDTLTALGALCVILYDVDPQYSQLTQRIRYLMQQSQNLFNFDAVATMPMMPRRGEIGYISDDDINDNIDDDEKNNNIDSDDNFDYMGWESD